MEVWKGITVLLFFLGFIVVWINLAVGITMIVISIGIFVISAVWNTSNDFSNWVEEHK